MINRKALAGLAGLTFVLGALSALMGQDFGEGNTLLWLVGDVVWFGFLLSALTLVVLSVAVLGRSLVRSARSRSHTPSR